MQFLLDLIRNPVFLSAAGSWFAAQCFKMILDLIGGRFAPDRLTGGGGMPSAHSATVCGLTTAVALTRGGGSAEFVIALFLAIIVIYDARGVRYVTGRQAEILNRLKERDEKEGKEAVQEHLLEENMGHTIPEILVGIAIGIAVSAVVCALGVRPR